MKDIIISVGIDGRDRYSEHLPGLEQSIKEHWKGDSLILRHFPSNVRHHSSIPYAFKYDLIRGVINEFPERKIFWLDSVMRLLKNPIELFEQSNSGIVAFHNLGHDLSPYLSDKAESNLKEAGVMHDYIPEKKMIWGGAIGFDFSKVIPNIIFGKIMEQIEMGSFEDSGSIREGFIASRHDQSCISVILDYYHIPLFPYGVIAAKNDVTEETFIQYGS